MAGALADFVLNFLSAFPDWLKVIVLSMMPITEYQFAIPYAIEHFHFSPFVAYLLALTGSACLFFPLYFGLEKLRELLVRIAPPLLKPIDMMLQRGERKLKDNYAKYGAFGLFLFLVFPFPFTGIWTATFAAVALKIPFREAGVGILFGVLGGQAFVALLTLATKAIV